MTLHFVITQSDFPFFIMKPHVESVEISSPMDITDGEYGEEQQTWSISVTNLPNDVFEDQETKVC